MHCSGCSSYGYWRMIATVPMAHWPCAKAPWVIIFTIHCWPRIQLIASFPQAATGFLLILLHCRKSLFLNRDLFSGTMGSALPISGQCSDLQTVHPLPFCFLDSFFVNGSMFQNRSYLQSILDEQRKSVLVTNSTHCIHLISHYKPSQYLFSVFCIRRLEHLMKNTK